MLKIAICDDEKNILRSRLTLQAPQSLPLEGKVAKISDF